MSEHDRVESPLLPFRSVGSFVLSTRPRLSRLYKCVGLPGCVCEHGYMCDVCAHDSGSHTRDVPERTHSRARRVAISKRRKS